MAERKDNRGRKLRTGEYYNPKTHIYQFRKMVDGERVTITDTDLEQLRKRENEILVAIDQGKNLRNRNKTMTLNDYFDFWFKTYAPTSKKPSTLSTYKKYYDLYIRDTVGLKRIEKVTKVDIQVVFNNLIGQGLKHSTLNILRSCLIGMMECAIDDDIITKNSARNVELPPRDTQIKEPVPEDPLNTFMDYVKNSPYFKEYYPMFVVLFNTGIRISELAALTWDNVDFAEETITIEKTLVYLDKSVYDFEYAIGTPKSKKSIRSISMNTPTKSALLQHKLKTGSAKKCTVPMIDDYGRVTGKCSDFVFTTNKNTVLRENVVRDRIHAIIKRYNAGVPGNGLKLSYFAPHVTRHTFTSKAYEAGADMKIVSELLGHSSTNITLDIYTHLTEKKQREKQETVKAIRIS